MDNIISFGNIQAHIWFNHFKHCWIGRFINTTKFNDEYGDTYNEVYESLEELYNKYMEE